MTNEEKAIISWTQGYNEHQFQDCHPSQQGFYQRGFVDGANWKDEQLNEIVQKAWDLFQRYATYEHPRKGIEMCVMNKQQFLKAINYNN